jgi:hypothetical protein
VALRSDAWPAGALPTEMVNRAWVWAKLRYSDSSYAGDVGRLSPARWDPIDASQMPARGRSRVAQISSGQMSWTSAKWVIPRAPALARRLGAVASRITRLLRVSGVDGVFSILGGPLVRSGAAGESQVQDRLGTGSLARSSATRRANVVLPLPVGPVIQIAHRITPSRLPVVPEASCSAKGGGGTDTSGVVSITTPGRAPAHRARRRRARAQTFAG